MGKHGNIRTILACSIHRVVNTHWTYLGFPSFLSFCFRYQVPGVRGYVIHLELKIIAVKNVFVKVDNLTSCTLRKSFS